MKFNRSETEGPKRLKLVDILTEDALLASIATAITIGFDRDSSAVWKVFSTWISIMAALIVYDLLKIRLVDWRRKRQERQQTTG